MNDWDNLDNFPTDDDDNEEFNWLDDDETSTSDDDLRWLSDDDDDSKDDAPNEWQMPRSDRAERAISSQIEDAEDADFGNTEDGLDWMSEVDETSSDLDMPDWLSGMDVPSASDEDIATAQADALGNTDSDWGISDGLDDTDWGVSADSSDDAGAGSAWDLFAEDGDVSEEPEAESWLASSETDEDDDASDDNWDLFAEDDDVSEEPEAESWLASPSAEDNDASDDNWDLFAEDDDVLEEPEAESWLASSETDEDDGDDFLFGASAEDNDDTDDSWDLFAEDSDTSEEPEAEDLGIWGDLGEDTVEESSPEPVADNSDWDLSGDDDFDFEQDDAGFTDEPVSEQEDLAVPDWLADMPLPEVIEPVATQTVSSLSDDDLGIPDWLDGEEPSNELDSELDFMNDLDAPIAEFQDDLGVPDWLDGEEPANELDSELDFMNDLDAPIAEFQDDLGVPDWLDEENVATGDLDDLLGDLDVDESDDDLGDLLASLDTDGSDGDLDDLLASLDTGNDDDEDLDDLFASLDMSSDDIPEADDLDFLDPVSEADDEFEILNQLNNMKTSDLDFMDGISRDESSAPNIDDEELSRLNELSKIQTGDLDFMAGVSRDDDGFFQDDDNAENLVPDIDGNELSRLNALSQIQTGDLDFMAGVSRDDDGFFQDDDNAENLVPDIELETDDLDFMADILRDDDNFFQDDDNADNLAPDIDGNELSRLNALSQIQTGDLDFMAGVSRDDDGFFQDDDNADLDYFNELDNSEDVQSWFDSEDEKPATGSLSFLDNDPEEIDSQPDWLEKISGIDTDTLREVAETSKKPKPVDIDALIDSFDVEDESSDNIVSATDLDSMFDVLDEETQSQLPDDLSPDALPDWLQEIAKGTDAASAASLIRQRHNRSVEDLDDRLLELHERGLELSSTTPDDSQNAQNLSKIVPNIDEALTPARANFTQAGLITSPNVTAEQAQRATLLQGLVGSAIGDDNRESRRVGINTLDAIVSRADRIIISLLLIGAVFIPFIYPGFDNIATLPPSEFAEDSDEFAAFSLIENIQPGQYVLLAAEYGATGARELDTATRSFLEHIITKGGIPVVVSSDAVGLLRAEAIIEDLLGEDMRNEAYYIAGFLPGGNIGLRDFAINLNTVVRSDLQGNDTGLDFRSVDEFVVILLISENGETVRNWMEQVAPVTDTSIIVVTGQSARPLALPYTSSSENTVALLTGYDDAFTYQQMVLGLYNPSPTPSPMETETTLPTATDLPTETVLPSDTPTVMLSVTDTPEPSSTPTDSTTAIPTLTPRPSTNTPEPDVSNTPIPIATLAPTDAPQADVEMIEIAVVSSESAANVRAGAGSDFSIISSIPTGEQLAIIERSIDDQWIRVILPDGSNGWISSSLLTIREIPASEFEGEAVFNDTVQIGTVLGDSRVNVRSGAGSEFEAVAGLDPNSRVEIIGTNEAGDWYNILLPNGGEGWIANFLLSVSEVPADEWQGASKDGFLPIYFDERTHVQQDNNNDDILLIGRNASGIAMPVYVDSEQSDILLELANGAEFIVIEEGDPLTQILTEGGQIGFIETRIIVIEERSRSEVDFAPTATLISTIAPPTATMAATITPTFVPQITPAPLLNPAARSSSQAFGLIIAIAIIAFGNLFWIFRWLGQREQ